MTLQRLERAVRWDRLRERPVPEGQRPEFFDRVIEICPEDGDLPVIRLHFDRDLRELHEVGFSEWHSHFETHPYTLRDLAYALGVARGLVQHRLSVLAQFDGDGRYVMGSLLPANEPPSRLDKRAKAFRRLIFNRPALPEDVPFTEYVEEQFFLKRKDAD